MRAGRACPAGLLPTCPAGLLAGLLPACPATLSACPISGRAPFTSSDESKIAGNWLAIDQEVAEAALIGVLRESWPLAANWRN